jgi:hypothetical protein
VGQRAFTLQRRDLGVKQLVVHGDLADLGFQPGDLIVAVIAFTFFQGGSRACERTLAPLAEPGDRDIRLPRTSSSGSPRNSRATIAILR